MSALGGKLPLPQVRWTTNKSYHKIHQPNDAEAKDDKGRSAAGVAAVGHFGRAITSEV